MEENLISFQLWRDSLGFCAEIRLRSKYLVLAESSAQFGFKLLVITDFQLQIAYCFLVLPQGRFLCTYANPCFRIFGSYSRESGATALEVRVCDVACFKPYFIFSLWYSVWWLAGGLHPPGISNDFSPTKKKKCEKVVLETFTLCLHVKGGKRHMKIFISMWERHKGLGYMDLLLFQIT